MKFIDRTHALLKWFGLSACLSVFIGSASALFLKALDWATHTHQTFPWLIFFLPFMGFSVGWVYLQKGQSVERGNNLLIDEIHDPRQTIPFRMLPLIFISTVLSHVFGASVGREGTAVQMGGALAEQCAVGLKLCPQDRRLLLMAGISGGFSAVFGTPLAGALFGLEVLAIGRLPYEGLFPCLMTALISHHIALLWGIEHAHYSVSMWPLLTPMTLFSVMGAGMVFGGIGTLFAESTHRLSQRLKAWIHYPPLRPFLGGMMIILAWLFFPIDRYLGLGLSTLNAAFTTPLPWYDFLGKGSLTVLSLGTGFKGGEVTPLFYIGATLGNALAPVFALPFSFLAALGLVAVFAGAANTPLTCTLMAIELFGADIGLYAFLACTMSYLFSSHSGIYRAQRIAHVKMPPPPT